jgi:hypothetical protein
MDLKRIFSPRSIGLIVFIFVVLFLGSLNWVRLLKREGLKTGSGSKTGSDSDASSETDSGSGSSSKTGSSSNK